MQTAMWAGKISLLIGTQADPADGGCTKLWVRWAGHLKVAEVLGFGGCRPDGVDPHLQARVSFRRCSDQTRPVHALERRDRHKSTGRVNRAGCPLSPYASGWYLSPDAALDSAAQDEGCCQASACTIGSISKLR